MKKVEKQLPAGKFTVLIFNSFSLNELKNKGFILVDGKRYETEIVYDLPNAIGIVGHGNFVGKYVDLG